MPAPSLPWQDGAGQKWGRVSLFLVKSLLLKRF